MISLKPEFIEKFKLDELSIKTVGIWIISLRPQQPTLGSLVLTLNRYCPSFADLSEVEATDLALAYKEIDKMYKSTFTPDKINYLALMMIDEQVHFHVIPRYSSVKSFGSRDYFDTAWPNPPSFSAIELSDIELLNILYTMKNA